MYVDPYWFGFGIGALTVILMELIAIIVMYLRRK